MIARWRACSWLASELRRLSFASSQRAVIAFERDAATAVEFENPAGDVVEEIAVVGDRDDGAGIFAEEPFEPRDAFGVEMVGRFVEQQHVRSRQQQFAQRDAALFAAGQIRNRGIPRRQPQRVGGDVERAVQIPAVRRVDLGLQIALPFEQRVHLVVGHRLGELVGDRVVFGQQRLEFGDAFFDVAAHVFARVELRFLRQEADFDAFLRPRFAVDRGIDAGHDPQQRRLSGTVQAEHADLRAGEKRQRNVLQNLAPAGHDLGDAVHGVDVLRHGFCSRICGPCIVVRMSPECDSSPAMTAFQVLGFRAVGYNAPLRYRCGYPSMFDPKMKIAGYDDAVWQAIADEQQRQEDHIELIASENYASPRVLQAQGTVLTNKYAEGYPASVTTAVASTSIRSKCSRSSARKQLFGAAFANVQPHSGSQANAAAYLALLSAGDVVLGMSLDAGGHLTHGAPVNFSGKVYHAVQYGLDAATGEVDYDQVAALAKQHRPKLIVAGFSAYSRKHGLATLSRHRGLGGGVFPGRHGARRRSGRDGSVSEPGAVRRRRHVDHAQDAARSARRHDPRARAMPRSRKN